MRFRQPDVERDHAGFHAKAEQEQHEQPVTARPRRPGGRRAASKTTASPTPPPAQKAGHQTTGADMRHHEYRYAARRLARSSCSVATSAAVASVISFPGKQERDDIVGDEHEFDGPQA